MARKKTKNMLPDLEKYLEGRRRRLVTYEQGAALYNVRYYTFVHLAKEANANFSVKKSAIVELDRLDKYLMENPDAALRLIIYRRES